MIFNERYRPQFHFTSRANWLNDPNGCVYFDGEYHLFFQHNPTGNEWGNMAWGHAVSNDLIHWQQLENAIEPYHDGFIFSGSAVVDYQNKSGLSDSVNPPILAFFTHTSFPFVQSLAYSNDRGRTWQLHNHGVPVISNQGLDMTERDPKILWHARSNHWVIVLWVKQNQVRFFRSQNLLDWEYCSDFMGNDFFECPDFFELRTQTHNKVSKWVLHDAAFHYWIGDFDGEKFTAESGPIYGVHGPNFYAAQTWNGMENRLVHIAWMRGGEYPDMPFNQQMSFPCELILIGINGNYRVSRYPISEIKNLYLDQFQITNQNLKQNQGLDTDFISDTMDISLDVSLKPGGIILLQLHHLEIKLSETGLNCMEEFIPFEAALGNIHLRVLLDRTSLEIFIPDLGISYSSCILPENLRTSLQLKSFGEDCLIRNLTIHSLKSAWQALIN